MSVDTLVPFAGEPDETVGARLEKLRPARLAVDLAGVEYLDSAGALTLLELECVSRARAVTVRFVNVPQEALSIMGLIDREALRREPLIPSERAGGFLEQVGQVNLGLVNDLVQILTFLGELFFVLGHSLLHPRAVRWGDVLFYMKRAGVDGLPIVGLIGLLLGLIIAFMSSLQLKQCRPVRVAPSRLAVRVRVGRR